jgi:hypothetical protein
MAELFQSSISSSKINVKIPEMKIDAMKSILDFIYEGKIFVQPENAVEILNAAKKFEISALQNYIMENMDKLICFDNIVGFYIATKNKMWNVKTDAVLTFIIG